MSTSIPLPQDSTTKLIFPSTDSNPLPGISSAYYLVDELPVVTSLLDGDDPQSCSHGAPQPTIQTPAVGFAPLVHTTVAVLTETGNPVTLAANPFGDGAGGTTSPNAPAVTPQQETQGPVFGPPTTVDGEVITPAASGAVIVDGQTISSGAVAVVGTGIPIAVGSSGIVVVGTTTITLASVTNSATHSSSSSSSTGVGAAIASGIGANKNNAFSRNKLGVITLEAGVLSVMFGILSWL